MTGPVFPSPSAPSDEPEPVHAPRVATATAVSTAPAASGSLRVDGNVDRTGRTPFVIPRG